MHAGSLLRSVRRIDDRGERLLSLRTFSGDDPARHVDVAMATLVDLAELLRTGAPFPPRLDALEGRDGDRGTAAYRPDGGSSESATAGDPDREADADALVRRVLATSYERGAAPVDRLESPDRDRVADDDRFETVDSWVIVPLSGAAPYARNWRPVLEALEQRIEGVLEDFRRIERRVRAAGSAGGATTGAEDADPGLLAAGCAAIVEMLETLALVVRRAESDARYVRRRTDHRQDELLATIETATTQLRSDDDA